MAAPVIDAVNGWVESSGTSFSHSFNRGANSNAGIVVLIQNQNASDNVNAPTYNGVSLSLLYKRQNTQAQTPTWNHYYFLAAPASGSNTLAFTTSSSCAPFWFVYALSGVKQTGQPDLTASNASASSNSSFSVTGTSTVNDVLLIGMSSDNNGNMAAGSSTTKRSNGIWIAGYGLQIMDSNSASNSAGSVTLNVTGSNGGKSDFTMIGIAPLALASISVSDTVTTTDTVQRSTSRSFSEALAMTDSASLLKTITLTIATEVINLVDSVRNFVSTLRFNDSVTVTDLDVRVASKWVPEVLQISAYTEESDQVSSWTEETLS